MKIRITPLLLSAVALPVFAAVPLEWEADIERPAPAALTVMRGETVQLTARLTLGGVPYDPAAASAALYYQTNGMGGTWWSAPASIASGVVSATFTPQMDPGAPLVSAFLAATDDDGSIYRAFATLRFLHAPGATPNALPLPVSSIDFAAVAVTNAPWVLPADLDAAIAEAEPGNYAAVSNAALNAVQTETDPTVPAWAKNPNPPLTEETDPVWNAEKGSYATAVALADTTRLAGEAYGNAADAMSGLNALNAYIDRVASSAREIGPAATNYADRAAAAAVNAIDFPDTSLAPATNYVDSALKGYVPTSRTVGGVALAADIPLSGGIVASNGTIRVYTGSDDNASLVFDSAAVLGTLRSSLADLARRVSALESAADPAARWADFDAQGGANPDESVLFLNRAYTALGAGYRWISSGAYWCLSSSGAVAFAADSGGALRVFSSDAERYVGLISGGSVLVGCDATGFSVSGQGAGATCSISYPYAGGDFPVIYGAPSLSGPWTEMTAPVWIAADGVATATFPATENSYFFKAASTVTVAEYWAATVPSYFPGGVKVSAVDISPVVYDSAITIQNDGKTYRIPAETVQQ